VLYWPLQAIVHLGPLAPFAAVGVARWSPNEPARRRLALCWLAVPAATFCAVATRNETYFLMFALPMVFFATVGLQLWLERRLPATWMAGTGALVFVALCWKLCDPVRSAVATLAGDLRAVSPPSAAGVLAVAALGAMTAGLWTLARGRHGRRLARVALGIVVLHPLYGCALLLRPQDAEWHEVRRAIAPTRTGRTLDLTGDTSYKARIYARMIEFEAKRSERRSSFAPGCVVTQDEALATSLAHRYPERQEHGDLVLLCDCCSHE
jgi:hypothetical protein